MSASTFIQKCYDICNNYKTLYVLGTWGWPATPNNKSRAIKKQSYNATTARKVKIENASRDTFFFDCAGLIKGILWGWCGDSTRTYGGAGYACDGVPDSSNLIGLCKDVSNDFTNITPGEIVSIPGHVGVYIGEGKVIECTPKWDDCVQISYLGNTGNTSGHYRMWDSHGKLPWIDYGSVLKEINTIDNSEPMSHEDIFLGKIMPYVVQKGDTLNKIAKKFSTTVDQIVYLNKLSNPNKIYVGQNILVQATAPDLPANPVLSLVYTVKPGDTLSRIARQFNTTVLALQAKNGILNPNKIVVGQVLKV